MDPTEIQFLAEKMRQFLMHHRKSFQQELIQRHSSPGREEISFQQDLSRLAVLLAMPNLISELTSLEREQLANRILLLVKPQEFDLAELRDLISRF